MTMVNRRILVIDDNLAIHEDFRKVLCPVAPATSSIDGMRAALFGAAPPVEAPSVAPFELDTADQGEAGLLKVMRAKQDARPYAVAFVDMRMPPGWDGLETIENLWYQDPELQVVICSAYSDHPWDDILRRVGQHDKLLVLEKPFNAVEVWQMASTLSKKWALAASVAQQMDSMSELVVKRTSELVAAQEELVQLKQRTLERGDLPPVPKEIFELVQAQTEYLAVLGREIYDPLNGLVSVTAQLSQTTLTADQRDGIGTVVRCAEHVRMMVEELVRLAPLEFASPSDATASSLVQPAVQRGSP